MERETLNFEELNELLKDYNYEDEKKKMEAV